MTARKRMKIMRWRESESKAQFCDPKAWEQTGSSPDAKPTKTEYPVMLVNPIERAPPASSKLPSLPKKRTETTALMYTKQFIAVIGNAIPHNSFNSSAT